MVDLALPLCGSAGRSFHLDSASFGERMWGTLRWRTRWFLVVLETVHGEAPLGTRKAEAQANEAIDRFVEGRAGSA